jgi:hypothetical protein
MRVRATDPLASSPTSPSSSFAHRENLKIFTQSRSSSQLEAPYSFDYEDPYSSSELDDEELGNDLPDALTTTASFPVDDRWDLSIKESIDLLKSLQLSSSFSSCASCSSSPQMTINNEQQQQQTKQRKRLKKSLAQTPQMTNQRDGNNGKRYQFQFVDLFTKEGTRCVVKAKQKRYFEIFPWFLIQKAKKSYRFRESLKGGMIELILDAMGFFWNEPFTDEDYDFMKSFYRKHFSSQIVFASSSPPPHPPPHSISRSSSSSLPLPPSHLPIPSSSSSVASTTAALSKAASGRCLSSILLLKHEIEKNRINLQFYQRIKNIVSRHDDRLTHLEHKAFPDRDDRPPFKKRRSSLDDEDQTFGLNDCLLDHKERIDALESQLPCVSPCSFISSRNEDCPLSSIQTSHDGDDVYGDDAEVRPSDHLNLLDFQLGDDLTTALVACSHFRPSRDEVIEDIASNNEKILVFLRQNKANETSDHDLGDGLDEKLLSIQTQLRSVLSLLLLKGDKKGEE